ncbi:hypothetical protein N7G274_001651 [Stereocaulon virgatum]|uniref:LAGLIDADG homing endonuclease n=1 Tax=Stereocaulon virgatum TaxID=373712 RepID=A0ABR4ANE5_9LECA
MGVYYWVRNTLTKERLVVNKKKPKHLFGRKELVQFTITVWTVNDDHFIHPRNKVQIPFSIAVFCWTGARTGVFFPKKKDDSKKSLQYRDIEFVLKTYPEWWVESDVSS